MPERSPSTRSLAPRRSARLTLAWRRALLAVLSTSAVACELPPIPAPGADLTPAASSSPPQVGVAAVKKRGSLRLLTRNNATSYFVWHGRMLGFDYELGERFASWLGVSLEVVVPPNWGDVLPMLADGKGDVAAAGLTITPEREKEVRFAKPYTLTHMRVVWGKGEHKISTPEDLAGKPVHVRMNSAYYRRLVELNGVFEAGRKRPIDIVLESEGLETEQILEEVAAGRIPYTLCDVNICQENKSYLPELVVGPRMSDPMPLAWAVNLKAVDLAFEIDKFMEEMRKNGELPKLLSRFYENPRRRAREQPHHGTKRGLPISPFDTIFETVAGHNGVDWRLLAAIAFEESGFDAKNEAWNGGEGLFGMLPATGRELGASDLKDPKAATTAAAVYLNRLGAQFASVTNDGDRQRLALAAFACGAGHVSDARLVATRHKLDPDQWVNVAASLRLLSRAEYAGKAEYGYVRGSEVAGYVDRVWGLYRAYRHAMGERDP
jgi:membrane-bound lytic murein transglycosylase F